MLDGARWQDMHAAKNVNAKSNLQGSVWITADTEKAFARFSLLELSGVIVIDRPAFHLQARLRPLPPEYSLISSLSPHEARLPVDLGKKYPPHLKPGPFMGILKIELLAFSSKKKGSRQ